MYTSRIDVYIHPAGCVHQHVLTVAVRAQCDPQGQPNTGGIQNGDRDGIPVSVLGRTRVRFAPLSARGGQTQAAWVKRMCHNGIRPQMSRGVVNRPPFGVSRPSACMPTVGLRSTAVGLHIPLPNAYKLVSERKWDPAAHGTLF